MTNLKVIILGLAILISFCYNAYAQNYYRNGVTMTEQVRAEHILVPTEKQAKDLKTRIENGESFEDIAREYSECPSGRNGGDLGYFTYGQMVKPFETAAFETEVGKISDPIQTQFGWHLIKVIDKK